MKNNKIRRMACRALMSKKRTDEIVSVIQRLCPNITVLRGLTAYVNYFLGRHEKLSANDFANIIYPVLCRKINAPAHIAGVKKLKHMFGGSGEMYVPEKFRAVMMKKYGTCLISITGTGLHIDGRRDLPIHGEALFEFAEWLERAANRRG